MFPKTASAVAAILAASRLTSAQTSTQCNPLQKTCPSDPAFGNKVTCDFTQGACDAFQVAAGTTLSYGSNGAVFKIQSEADAPTIHTGKYIFFGRVDVTVQAAAGQGIVTSAVLLSDDLDEIDFEWTGGESNVVQTNYFSKGDTSTYDRGSQSAVSNTNGQFHTYSIDWTPQKIDWYVDGNIVRTLTYEAAHGGATYPQTPMQVKLGTWVGGGKNSAPGTVQWAGGYTDFSKAPFLGYYKSVVITDYAGTSSPASGGIKEYVYGDKSGSKQSIKVIPGDSGSDNVTSQANTEVNDTGDAILPPSAGPSNLSTSAATSTLSAPSSSAAASNVSGSTSASTSATASGGAAAASGSRSGSAAGSGSGSGSGSATGSGSGSGSGSSSNASAIATTATRSALPSGSVTSSRVPTSSATHGIAAIGSVLLAGAGIILSQLLL